MTSRSNLSLFLEEKIKSDTFSYKRSLIALCAIYTLLSIFCTVHALFVILNFLLCAYVIVQYSNKIVVPFMVYGTFFASIFKMPQVTPMSFFTFVILLYTIKLLKASSTKADSFYLLFLIFFAFTLAVQVLQGDFSPTRNIKFYSAILYMYIVSTEIDYYGDQPNKVNSLSVAYAFVFGVLFSSLARFLDGSFFKIVDFVTEKTSNFGTGTEDFTRFSGLYGDPNYYAINVILALVVLAYLFSRMKIKTVPTILLFSVFTAFAIMTTSKSAFLMLAFAIFVFVRASQKRGNFMLSAFLLLIAIVVVYLAVTNQVPWFDNILKRFENDNDISSFTTGRTDIWLMYLEYFSVNPLKLLFGSGISSPLVEDAAAHNTYIDILYHLGLIGGLLFLMMIKKIVIKHNPYVKSDICNRAPLIILLIMYFFLSSLFDIDLTTNILLITITYNSSFVYEEIENVKQDQRADY